MLIERKSRNQKRIANDETSGGSTTLYYSTQTDPQHAQKIVQQTTNGDFDSWGTAIDVVALNFRDDKPGMTTATKVLQPFNSVGYIWLNLLAPE